MKNDVISASGSWWHLCIANYEMRVLGISQPGKGPVCHAEESPFSKQKEVSKGFFFFLNLFLLASRWFTVWYPFLLYSKVTHTDIYMLFLILSSILFWTTQRPLADLCLSKMTAVVWRRMDMLTRTQVTFSSQSITVSLLVLFKNGMSVSLTYYGGPHRWPTNT